MARTPRPSADEEEDPEPDEDEEDLPPRRARRPARNSGRHPPRGRPRPLRRWGAATEPDEDEPALDAGAGTPRDAKRGRVFWRARDSLYFAPLVALAIVILLVVSLYAFTQNWPPVYVVESESMQHGSSDILGVINTGDLVLAQKVPDSSILTYVAAQTTGYSTYGEYGDVLLYSANGVPGTPVIHRAIVYLDWVPSVRGYTALGLLGQPCGTEPGAVYATPGTNGSCGTTDLTNTLDLFHVGWADVNVTIPLLPALLGTHSGYVTMGDNNQNAGQGLFDQLSGFQLSTLVEPAWVIGVARGIIPWVGALKLWLEGSSTAGEVPPQSWQFLGLTFAGIILLAFGLHYALRVEGIEDPRRKAAEDAEDEEETEAEEGSAARARHFLRSIRPWGHAGGPAEEEEEEPPIRTTHRSSHPAPAKSPLPPHRGRPKPKVRRPRRGKATPDDDDSL